MVDRILNFIPGIERNKQYSSMNQAVINYRDAIDGVNPNNYKRKFIYYPDKTVEAPYKLKNFQRDGILNARDILDEYRGVIIADEMGLGKTIEAIVLSNIMQVTRILYVVPANTIGQWQSQILKWSGKVAEYPKTKKYAGSFAPEGNTCIISYELLDSLNKALKWDMIIYDEIHKLRSRSSKMSLAAREWRNRAELVVGLTGSLQWGYTRDMWNPLRCVFYYRFGTADEFDFTYCGASYNEHGGKENKGFKSSDGIDRSEELAIRLSHVSIRRTKFEVASELPPLERKIIRIPCTQKATLALNGFLMKQLPYMNAIMSTTSEKTQPVLDIIDNLENAIIFTWTKADVATIASEIHAKGKPVSIITSATSKAERAAIMQYATQNKAFIVATIDSIGVGVDGLQFVTNNVIFHSLSPSPKIHLQAESRLHRIGQTNPVTVWYIVMTDSADEFVIKILTEKSTQDTAKTGDENTSTPFKNLYMNDDSMRQVIDEWVKTATDEINEGVDNSWSDEGDDD